jgi:hypothetical protein
VRYTVVLTDEVKGKLRAIPVALHREIGHKLFMLEDDLGGDVKKLKGSRNGIPLTRGRLPGNFRSRRSDGDGVCYRQPEGYLPMSTAVLKSKSASRNHFSSADIDKQIRRGRAVLRELKTTLEDLEDRRELAAARKRNGSKAGTPLRQAAKELGL